MVSPQSRYLIQQRVLCQIGLGVALLHIIPQERRKGHELLVHLIIEVVASQLHGHQTRASDMIQIALGPTTSVAPASGVVHPSSTAGVTSKHSFLNVEIDGDDNLKISCEEETLRAQGLGIGVRHAGPAY